MLDITKPIPEPTELSETLINSSLSKRKLILNSSSSLKPIPVSSIDKMNRSALLYILTLIYPDKVNFTAFYNN